jgi:hypothetical protein
VDAVGDRPPGLAGEGTLPRRGGLARASGAGRGGDPPLRRPRPGGEDRYLPRDVPAAHGRGPESDYPALAHFLGETRWPELVGAYCEAHPSESYTLNLLGRHLPGWLAEVPGLRHRGFCRDLARLEWAVALSFDAEEVARLDEAELTAVPPEAWEAARLVPRPALRLLELDWNANEWLDSTKGDRHEHPHPRRRKARVAVFRLEYAVYRRELSVPAFRLLSDLASGLPVGPAVAAAMERRAAPDPDTLGRWFRGWAADGLFTRVERESPATP